MQTISGATGTICQKDGLYKASDRRAQYLELIIAGSPFPNFPGGKGNKTCTWYLVTGNQATNPTTISDNDGTVTVREDGGFSGVVAIGE
jgi:hypothetical protein